MKGNYNEIREGDALQQLKEIDDDSIDLLCTDPPYGYSFMNKDWDKAVVSVDVWRECLRVLKAGAFAFVMSAPRQDVLSRMIVNLQDAGFRTDFTSIYYSYASGFPKATNVSKLIDKRLGVEREVVGKYKHPRSVEQGKDIDNSWGEKSRNSNNNNNNVYQDEKRNREERFNITSPATEAAKKLDGSYAGFQPKPAVEVVLTVMKPLSEKSFVDQALNNGKGITWLDDCRIPHKEQLKLTDRDKRISNTWEEGSGFKNENNNIASASPLGRFPANLLVSDDALNDGKIRKKSGRPNLVNKIYNVKGNVYGKYNDTTKYKNSCYLNDVDSYSRFFDLDAWYSSHAQFIITPKASPSERNKGLEGLPLVERGHIASDTGGGGGWKADRNKNPNLPRQNHHPTVKPLKLMSYLITLGSRENDIVLDPFCGSGTTLIAAHLLNRRWIGIELNTEYAEIARKRIEPYLIQQKLL